MGPGRPYDPPRGTPPTKPPPQPTPVDNPPPIPVYNPPPSPAYPTRPVPPPVPMQPPPAPLPPRHPIPPPAPVQYPDRPPPAPPPDQPPMVQQATVQDAAISDALHSIMDALSLALNTRASASNAALNSVKTLLRSTAKQVGQVSQDAINTVLTQIGTAVDNGDMLNESMLTGLVSQLAGATVPRTTAQQSAQGEYVPTASTTQGYKSAPPPLQGTDIWSPPNFAGVTGYCPEGYQIAVDSKYSWEGNPQGMYCQLVGPTGPQPVQPTPPPTPPLPLLGYPPGPPTPPTPPPTPPLPPGGYQPSACAGVFDPNNPQWNNTTTNPPCQTSPAGDWCATHPLGQQYFKTVTSATDTATGVTVTGDGAKGFTTSDPSYYGWIDEYGCAFVAKKQPQPQPTGPPAPPPQPTGPTGPPPPAPPGKACSIAQLPTVSLNLSPRIGSADWCAAINATSTGISLFGSAVIAALQAGALPDPTIPSPLPDPLRTLLSALPWGVGTAIIAIYDSASCVWNLITSEIRNIIIASASILNSVTCGNPGLILGLVVVRGILSALKRFRVGTDAGLWATVDITVEWDQAEAAIEYLIKYNCPYGIPGAAEAMELYRGGWISIDIYRCWMGMNNADPEVFSPVLEQGRPRPAIAERQQMLWRLRPGKSPDGVVFDDAAFETSLIKDGTDYIWRKMQYDIRYNPYTLREIRQLLDSGVVGLAETTDAFRDMGFAPDKAETLAKMEMVLTARRRESEIQGLTPSVIKQLYAHGAIQPVDVDANMAFIGYTGAQAAKLRSVTDLEIRGVQAKKYAEKAESQVVAATEASYKLGTISPQQAQDTLTAMGAITNSAIALIQAWETEVQLVTKRGIISSVRAGIGSGYLSIGAATEVLQTAGISNGRTMDLINSWQLERTAQQHTVSTGQILASVAAGEMDAATAGARLANLNWENADAQLLVAESEKKLQATLARAESAALKSEQAATKAMHTQQQRDQRAAQVASAKAAKAAESLARNAVHAKSVAVAALKRETPVATLGKWLKEGLISADAYTARLELMEFSPGVAQTMADSICGGKGASCVSAPGPDDANLANPPS